MKHTRGQTANYIRLLACQPANNKMTENFSIQLQHALDNNGHPVEENKKEEDEEEEEEEEDDGEVEEEEEEEEEEPSTALKPHQQTS